MNVWPFEHSLSGFIGEHKQSGSSMSILEHLPERHTEEEILFKGIDDLVFDSYFVNDIL